MIDTRLAAVIVLTLSSAGLAAGQFPTPQQARLPQPQQPAIQEPRGAIWGVVVSGTLQDPMGSPTSAYTVVVFPADPRYWLPSGRRRIQGTRPTTTGRFSFSGLPPGQYRLAALTDVETGIWYDPTILEQIQAASIPISLGRGESVTQDLRVGR